MTFCFNTVHFIHSTQTIQQQYYLCFHNHSSTRILYNLSKHQGSKQRKYQTRLVYRLTGRQQVETRVQSGHH